VAALVLRRGARTEAELYEVLDAVTPVADKDALNLRLRALYPDARGHVRPLEPDLLGEALVLRVLRDRETPGDFVSRVLPPPGHPHQVEVVRHTFQVLARIGLDAPNEVRSWMRQALDTDFETRVPWALSAALAAATRGVASPMGQVLAQELETRGTADQAELVSQQLPKRSVSLSELGVWSSQTLARTATTDADRARWLTSSGKWLTAVGRGEEALRAAEEALSLYVPVTRRYPKRYAHELRLVVDDVVRFREQLGVGGEASVLAEAKQLLEELQSGNEDE
jgi:hypothetical protein